MMFAWLVAWKNLGAPRREEEPDSAPRRQKDGPAEIGRMEKKCQGRAE